MHLPHKPRRGEHFELLIDGLTPKGQGTASIAVTIGPQTEERTMTFHVRKAIPGDRIVARVEKVRRNLVEAGIETLIEPSPRRIPPRCTHFGRREIENKGCGGCTLQSLEYTDQLAWKRAHIGALMASAGLSTLSVAPVLPVPDPWYYRNKMEFSFGDDRQRLFALGLHPAGWSKEVFSLTECHIASPFTRFIVPGIQHWASTLGLEPFVHRRGEGFLRTLTVREGKRTGAWMIELTTASVPLAITHDGPQPPRHIAESFTKAANQIAAAHDLPAPSLHWTEHRAVRGQRTRIETHHMSGPPALLEEMVMPGGHRLLFEIHPRAFFQPNTLQAETLYGHIIAQAGLREHSGAHILDLYCGTGTIGLCLAPFSAHVTGVDLVPDAINNAHQNAAANNIHNVTFIAADATDALKGPLADQRFDLVIVDPPRSGLHPHARVHLTTLAPDKLIYVSCNPTSLARDLSQLITDGYKVTGELQPVDMFPHTAHIETVAVLTR